MQQNKIKAFKEFFKSSSASGIITFAGVILSMIIANTPLASSFNALLQAPVGYNSGSVHLRYPVQVWMNDGLMAVFFLMVALEIKREMIEGELSTIKKALLPILCAIGGAITPAIIYVLFNKAEPTAAGWGIPMATDIAFALAIISMLGKRVPASLKIFLAVLATVDDLVAIVVIAIFYAGELHTSYLLYSVGVVAVLFILNRLKVKKLVYYLVPGVILWYFIHHSGIHATIAGVLTAMFIPVSSNLKPSPLKKLEQILITPVNFLIVPLFAFFNTNITLQSKMIEGLATPVSAGIILGLVIGKPVGIVLVSLLGVKTGLCELPARTNLRHIAGVGVLAGVGFTVSIFMALLSFTDSMLIAQAKFSILCASLIAALGGYLILRLKTN